MIASPVALHRKNLQRGFTLIEVLTALIILGGSLIVLLGLQSSILDRTFRDLKRQRALLLARQIFSSIEISEVSPEIGTTEGDIGELISRFVPDGGEESSLSPEDQEFTGQVIVESWGLPEQDPDVMRKVTVTLRWGEGNQDTFSSVYFIAKS